MPIKRKNLEPRRAIEQKETENTKKRGCWQEEEQNQCRAGQPNRKKINI